MTLGGSLHPAGRDDVSYLLCKKSVRGGEYGLLFASLDAEVEEVIANVTV